MADLPAYPDAGEPCVNNTDLILIARCVNGLRVPMWVWSTEISGGVALTGTCADCGKAAVVKAMVDKGMSAKDITTVLKAMG